MPQTNGDKQSKPNIDKISEEIVIAAAKKAALAVPGVYSLCDTLADNLTRMIVGRDQDHVGLKVSVEKNNKLDIDVSVIVCFGMQIPQLAWELQSAVKDAVEELTQRQVERVNIHIQGVHGTGKGK